MKIEFGVQEYFNELKLMDAQYGQDPSGKDGEGLQARQRRGDADQDRHPAIQGK